MACHGPTGAGNPGPAYPAVAGQQSAYAQRRLEEYRAGTTTQTDPHLFNIMATVAKPLTDEEIQSLASYVQGLHPRADEATRARRNPPRRRPPHRRRAETVLSRELPPRRGRSVHALDQHAGQTPEPASFFVRGDAPDPRPTT